MICMLVDQEVCVVVNWVTGKEMIGWNFKDLTRINIASIIYIYCIWYGKII